MWILPKPLHTLPSASDTEALISDLKEQSEMCAQSLFRKSSPSPSRTWLASWKRDSWSQLLCGRILKPSLGKNFTERWTSFQAAFPVNLFQVQAAEQAMKTQGISSPTSSTVSSDLDSQDLFSLKTWKESLVPNSREKDGETLREPRFCSMSSESWKGWVTTQRQQWSQRQSAALRTGASVSSSLESVTTWPTAQTSDANGAASPDRDAHRKQLRDVETGMGAWPTPTTAEADKISNQANYGQQGLSNHPAIVGERTREKGKKSRSGEAMWPTMTAQEAHNTLGGSNYNRVTIPLGTMALMHGQADPDSANTSGNHQGLSEEQSQRNWQTFAPGTHDRGAIPHRQVVKGLVTGEKAKTQCLTVDQVFAEEIKGTNPSWATPNTMDTLPPRSPEALKRYITEMRPGRTNPCNLREQVDPETMEAFKTWSTPRASSNDENIETFKARMERLPESFSMPLQVQVQEFPTPRTTDYKSTPNAPSNADRVENGLATLGEFIHESQKVPQVKSTAKLNPRWVEALMGLPIGWVNPLCTNPIAIVHQNSECLETESSPSLVSEPSESSSTGSAPSSWATPNCMDIITPTRDLSKMDPKGHWGAAMNTGKLSEQVNQDWATPMESDHNMSNQPRRDGGQEQLPNQVGRIAQQEWSTPTTVMAPETVDPETFNGKFFKKPDGRKHQTDLQLQAQMHGNGDPRSWPTPTLSDEESLETWAARRERKLEQGINLHKPLSIAVRQELEVDEPKEIG